MQQIMNSYIICTYVHNTVREKEDINNNNIISVYAYTSRVSVGGTVPQTRGGDHPASLRIVLGGLSPEVKWPRPEAGASHLNLVPRVRISGTILSMPSWYYAEVEQKTVEKEALTSARSSLWFHPIRY